MLRGVVAVNQVIDRDNHPKLPTVRRALGLPLCVASLVALALLPAFAAAASGPVTATVHFEGRAVKVPALKVPEYRARMPPLSARATELTELVKS